MLRAPFVVLALSLSAAGCGGDPSSPALDAAVPDAGAADAGAGDSGARDAAVDDAGLRDAGGGDASSADAGAGDAGPGDAGGDVPDAGPLGVWGEGFLLPPPDGRDSFAQFGSDVAIGTGGARVAVGDLGSRQVSVYEPDGDGWTRADVLEPPTDAFSSFGWAVDLDADATTLAVSAPPQAVVFVFERGASGWSEPTELRASGDPAGFGASIALSGDGRRLVVGAASVAPSSGVFVFDRVGDAWGDAAALALPEGAAEAGSRVAIDAAGVRLVSGDTGRGARVGAAAVYDRASGWGLPQPLDVPTDAVVFAFDVAISGDGSRLAVSDSFAGDGAVSVYRRVVDAWIADALPAPPGAAQFGYAIVLDGAGTTLFSGDTAGAGGGGQITEHVRDASGWRYAATLPRPDGARDLGFAIDVSADGRVLVASDLNGGDGDMGTAYVFRR